MLENPFVELAGLLLVAAAIGWVGLRLRQPLVVGFVAAGVLAGPAGLVALDARVGLHAPDVPEQAIPRPAIRPYPVEYVGELIVKDGTRLRVRPIRPEDEEGVRAFHTRLSETTVRNRYMQPLPVEINQLDNQALVRYYEREWRKYE